MKIYRRFLKIFTVFFSLLSIYSAGSAWAQGGGPATRDVQKEVQKSFLNREYPKLKGNSAQKGMGEGQFQAVDLGKRSFSPYWDRPYMLAAYALFWLVIFIYFLAMAIRLSKLERQVLALEKKLKENDEW